MSDVINLKRQVVTGVAWASATRLAGQLLNWGITIGVIRLLRPSDYGLMAITVGVTGVLHSMSYLGFTDALVQARDLEETTIRKTFGFIILVNCGLMLTLVVAAPAIAAFYGEPMLSPMLRAASFSFLLVAVSSVPRAMLDKALALKLTSRVEMLSNLGAALTTLAFAWYGFGVWSLLSGYLMGQILRGIGLWLCWPQPVAPIFSLRGTGWVLRFGSYRTVETFVWILYMQMDVFLIGRLAGSQVLGIYSVARTLAAIPLDKVAVVIMPIAMAAFSRVQSRPELALEYLAKAARLLAFGLLPVFLGLAAIAPEVVPIVLGPRWLSAALPLALLAPGMAPRLIASITASFLIGLGAVRTSMTVMIICFLIFAVAYTVGSLWGIEGICIAATAASFLWLAVMLGGASTVQPGAGATLARAMNMPLVCAVAMLLAVQAIRVVIGDGLPRTALLASLVATGAASYAVVVSLLCRSILRELRGLALS